MANRFGRNGFLDLTGKEIHNFTVVKKVINRVAKSTGREYIAWLCKCKCGNEFVTTTKSITRKTHSRKSCGCLNLDSRFRKSLTGEQAHMRHVISQYVQRTKKKKYKWNLTEEEATKILLSDCYYCGQPPSRIINIFKNCNAIKVSGIDRIDSKQGYCVGNVVPCCKTCNTAKSVMSQKDFYIWIKKVWEHINENSLHL